MRFQRGWALGVLLAAAGCGKGSGEGGGCDSPVTDIYPSGASGAPTLEFRYGTSTATTGTLLSSGNVSTYASTFLAASSACGAFGVTENGSGGATDTATEIEMRLRQRASVYAMAPGVVVYIQPSTDPLESGEVEGVWVRYGQDYVIKYVHVLNPVVSEGDRVETGTKIGTTPAFMQGGTTLYFWEVEVQHKSGSSVTSVAWNTLLSTSATHQSSFTTLYSDSACGAVAGTSNWKANSSSGEIDSTNRTQPCAFP
jgi:hypothetical protein